MNFLSEKKILVVDDEPSIRDLLAELLSPRYEVLLGKNGSEGIHRALTEKPDLILLDVIMPGLSGLEVCKIIREHPQTFSIPVIMLTAVSDLSDRTKAFENGADDYIAKPFQPEELLARIDSKIRRATEAERPGPTVVLAGSLRLDFEESKASIGSKDLDVGAIELKILNCLVKNQGLLVSRQTLQKFVWGDEVPSERALDPHIALLRKKLGNHGAALKTVYGKGYSLILKD